MKTFSQSENIQDYLKSILFILVISILIPSSLKAQEIKSELPDEKQTTLKLYVTSKEAYDLWNKTPNTIKILDVRTLDEYIYVGHAEAAYNIPAFEQTQNWDEKRKHFSLKPNPDFLEQVKKVFKSDDTILVTCRSGGRSAMAVNQLAKAGYKNVYNITDGFEGDKVKDPASTYVGKRMRNGWKNSGLPFTYSINPKQVILSNNE